MIKLSKAYYQANPIQWIKTIFPGMILWDKQKAILDSAAKNPETWIKSGQSVSKTFTLSLLPLWWLSCFSPALCLTTAPTWMQVENQLWGNLRMHYHNAALNLGGKMLLTEWRKAENIYALGLSTAEPEKFQGYHNPNILVIVDEGPGLKEQIWEAIDAVLTSANSRLVVAGNPLSKTGRFWQAFEKPKEGRKLIHITCQEAVKSASELGITGMVTQNWIDNCKSEWGEKNPLYISRVTGEFPDETEDTLFPLSFLNQTVTSEQINYTVGVVVIGVDVARSETGDETVIIPVEKSTGRILEIIHYHSKDERLTRDRLLGLTAKYQTEGIYIDDIGVGGGLTTMLRDTILERHIIGVNVANSPSDKNRFLNRRAEYYWRLREAFQNNKIKVPIEYKDRLFAQLSPIKVDYSSGKIQIERKDKMKARGLPSPDWADALMLAWSGIAGREAFVITAEELENPYRDYKDKVIMPVEISVSKESWTD